MFALSVEEAVFATPTKFLSPTPLSFQLFYLCPSSLLSACLSVCLSVCFYCALLSSSCRRRRRRLKFYQLA